MECIIFYGGCRVGLVSGTSVEAAQQHADAVNSQPVVVVPADADLLHVEAARYKSVLLAAKVTDRIDMIADRYAHDILAGLGGNHSEGTRAAVIEDLRAALHLFRQCSNSGMAAALRDVSTRSHDKDAKEMAHKALEAAGVQ